MSPTTRLAVESFWEYIAFALNSIVFLLIGFDVSVASLGRYWPEILAAVVAMMIARFGVVFAVTTLLRRTAERVPPSWSSVLAWGGIRGGLSIVLALGLPRDLPHREQLVTMTVGVVLISILLQGITMAPLLRRLGLTRNPAGEREFERERAELRVASLAMQEIQGMLERHSISERDAESLTTTYRARLQNARARLDDMASAEPDLQLRRRYLAVRHLLALEKASATEDLREEAIVPDTYEDMSIDLAARLVKLESGSYTDPVELLADSRAKGSTDGKS
jgi:CPA1 family monovalent cation:H+ antiporter